MDLESIPGVGPKTAERLRELEDPEAAVERGDVAAIARTPGITEGRAVSVVRNAIRQRHGDCGEFLATDRAESVYEDVLDLLRERAVTDYGAKRLATLYPSASSSRIDEVREMVGGTVGDTPDSEVADALADVAPVDEPEDLRVRDRCLVTGDAEVYATARKQYSEVDVELIEDGRELEELARDYSTVVVIDERYAGVDVEGVRVDRDALDDPVSVVPERVLGFFAANRERIRAAIRVHELAGLDVPDCADSLEEVLDQLGDGGTVVGDDEVARLSSALDAFDGAVADAEGVANRRMEDAINEKDVTIQGADLLSLAEQGGDINSVISETLADEYEAAVGAARQQLVDALQLEGNETGYAADAFTDAPSYPVTRDEQAVARLRDELTTRRDRIEIRRKRELAEEMVGLREEAEELVDRALEYDVERAIARFADDFDCTMPERCERGFHIEGGRNPLLDLAFEDVEPVDYGVDGVALLSGVNSGGKTSTLDLAAVVTVLAHMGLPVPADSARVPAVEELHYHGKTSGTLDAGAFESTLRDFGKIVSDSEGQLVLVDELESITEPGASAKIVAGVLEALDDGGATAVFVSHLADEIREECHFDVTVDGIRALGLEDGELRVDRSPVKNHLARSTPELIVEKMADGDGFYSDLLDKFSDEDSGSGSVLHSEAD